MFIDHDISIYSQVAQEIDRFYTMDIPHRIPTFIGILENDRSVKEWYEIDPGLPIHPECIAFLIKYYSTRFFDDFVIDYGDDEDRYFILSGSKLLHSGLPDPI